MTIRKRILLITGCLCCAMALGAELTSHDDKSEISSEIQWKNQFYDVAITPKGARIKSLILSDNRQLVLFQDAGDDGWLDDKGELSAAAFKCNKVVKSDGTVVLRYTYTETARSLTWEKTFTLTPCLPVISVHYTIVNSGNSDVRFEQMVRNMIKPMNELICCFYTDEGLQRFPWNEVRHGHTQYWYRSIVRHGFSLLNLEDNWGVQFVCDPLDDIYFYSKYGRGTAEWYVSPVQLKPGQKVESDVNIILRTTISADEGGGKTP